MITSKTSLLRTCKGAVYYKDFDVDHKEFKDDEFANPCGLLARFFPQDEAQFLRKAEPEEDARFGNSDSSFETHSRSHLRTDQSKSSPAQAPSSPPAFFPPSHGQSSSQEAKLPIDRSSIADPYYSSAFKPSGHQWIDPLDGRFVNWIKASSTKSFLKFWGEVRGERSLAPGDYVVEIKNRRLKRL